MNIDRFDRKRTIVVYPDSRSLARCFGWDKKLKNPGSLLGGYDSYPVTRMNGCSSVTMKDEFQTEGPLVQMNMFI
jgi:hypothetical protein